MDTRILEQIGLTKSEIKVYFALLELGTSTVGPILSKSKVPNSKIYLLLARLVEKGLASFAEKEGVKHYNAESPNRLMDYIELKKSELEKEKQELKNLLPLMAAKQKAISENTAKVFEGRRGLYSAYEDIIENLSKNDEMLFFSIGEENLQEKWVQNFFQEFAEKRIRKGITSKGLYPAKLKSIIKKHFKKKPLQAIRFFNITFPTGIVIYDSKVLLLDWRNLIVFMICSQEVSESYRNMFNQFWEKAKE